MSRHEAACLERAMTTAGLRTRMYYWVTSGAMSDKGQLKELDMTHLERKYLKIAKNCHRTAATGSLCG